MKRLMTSLIVIVAMATTGCSSSSQADTVDTNTKVLASNIIIDNSKTNLSATNLQSAIEELAPTSLLSSVLVGTWNILNYPDKSTGTVTFSADGVYSVMSGAFKVVGSAIDAPYTGKWQIIEGKLLELSCDITDGYKGSTTGNDSGLINLSSQYPFVVTFSKSKIILRDTSTVSVLSPS